MASMTTPLRRSVLWAGWKGWCSPRASANTRLLFVRPYARAWPGLRCDDAANMAGADRVSASHSAIEVRVIAIDEEAMIAQHTPALMRH